MKRIALWGLASLIAILALAEAAVRLAGAVDFPLYRADPALGYVPAPNQRGVFMGRDWAFNEHSMGVTQAYHRGPADVVLIGDSLVYGGNPYRQAEKLGPQLEAALHRPVWPIGAGSWALLNELAYFRLHPDVQGETVFVTNSGDFVTPSVWRSDLTHPRRHPLCAACYIGERVLAPMLPHGPPPPDNLPTTKWLDGWAAYRPNARVLIVAYPNRAEARDPALRRSKLAPAWRLMRPGVKILDVGADPRWSPALYRDDIHPTAAGMKVLAGMIAEQLH